MVLPAPSSRPSRAAPTTIPGTDGDDTLTAGAMGDVLLGYEGNDLLLGAAGDDRLEGDLGNDTLDGGAGDDEMLGGEGDDVFYVDSLDDVVDGGVGQDHLIFDLSALTAPIDPTGPYVSTAGVSVSGIESYEGILSRGSDTLVTTFQLHDLDGSVGTDLLVLDYSGTFNGLEATRVSFRNFASFATAEVVVLSDGSAYFPRIINFERYEITGTAGSDLITTEDRGDVIDGGLGNDTLNGEGGADTLIGGQGDDVLLGGDGPDELRSGPGINQLTGGTGADTFIFDPDGVHTVTDFEASDTLVLPLDLSQSRGTIIGGAGTDLAQRSNGDGWLFEILVTDVGSGVELTFSSRGFSLITPDVPTTRIELEGITPEDVSLDWFEFI